MKLIDVDAITKNVVENVMKNSGASVLKPDIKKRLRETLGSMVPEIINSLSEKI